MFRGLTLFGVSVSLLVCVACGTQSMTHSVAATGNQAGASGNQNGAGPGTTGNGGTGSSGSGSSAGSGSGSSTGSGGSSSNPATPASTNSTYIYVSSAASGTGSTNQISGFSADANGHLREISGSPFAAGANSIAVAGSHVYGVSLTAKTIDAFAIGSNGALTHQTDTNYVQYPSNCGTVTGLFPDRTGADLYTVEFNGDCANNFYQSFAATDAGGSLKYLGTANGGAGSFMGIERQATILGNNSFAYQATNNSCMYYSVSAFSRSSSGVLTESSAKTTLPAPPSTYRIYIPTFAAADGTNHVAITMLPANPPGCDASAKTQIASFTADAMGNLTTTNTYATMPTSSIRDVTDLKISPAGDLLAVGGSEGLQLFQFNGAEPVTPLSGILTVDPITEMFWDAQNHLYVISQKAGTLHVFTVAGSKYFEAPGSPYAIQQPQSLAVDSQR